MALGALPLVSPAPALAELVDDPRLTVPLRPEAWADRIHWWLAHEDARARASDRLVQRARAQHAWAAIADAWLRRYARAPRSAHA
jgi:glycosyltransferase involved in cell wall biosynthesis